MRRNGAPPSALQADPEGEDTKKEEDGNATKKRQRSLQIKTVEEYRPRKSTTFKPPNSNDFQNAADTLPADLFSKRHPGELPCHS
jgi:hypothetical protein